MRLTVISASCTNYSSRTYSIHEARRNITRVRVAKYGWGRGRGSTSVLSSTGLAAMAQDVSNDTNAPPPHQSPSETILKQHINSPDPEICVICLETLSERVVALPCKHACFDFPCLGNWLTKHRSCPICKGEVGRLEYEFNGAGESKIFYIQPTEPDQVSHSGPTYPSHPRRQSRTRINRSPLQGGGYTDPERNDDPGLQRRRVIYRNRLLSSHVGTNRISRYRNLKPQCFRDDEVLLSRARKWIRRELQVFDFLNSDCTAPGGGRCRANNAEFLLEYIIAILKTTDIKGSGGHAEELLKDFLGRDNTRVFLHELLAWLRSPYEHLRDWDRTVQYNDSTFRQRDEARSRIGGTTRSDSTSSCSSSSQWPSASQHYRYIPD